jgi:hypothetical protein
LTSILERVLRDAPDLVASELQLFRTDPSPELIGDVQIRLAAGQTSARSDVSAEELAQETASLVQDYIADEYGVAWPEVLAADGTGVGVLDAVLIDGLACWSGRGFAVLVGSLRVALAERDLRINEPWLG